MSEHKQSYAEDVNYWMTSRSSADAWMEKTKRELRSVGGKVTAEAFLSETETGRSAFMLAFELGSDRFKLVWHVLKSRTGKSQAARIQAATALYHDVKTRVVRAKWSGARAAFMEWLLLPDGRTVGEASTSELAERIPSLFSRPQLTAGNDIVDGEFFEED